jgi:hypothetical protein
MESEIFDVFHKEIELAREINEIFNLNLTNVNDRIFILVKILASYARKSTDELDFLNHLITKFEEIKTNREIDMGYKELFVRESEIK